VSARLSSADAVVVGGGILGLCAAFHLRELGAERVVLLERESATATQTTAAGAGFVSHWGGGELALETAPYGLSFYSRLQEEAAGDLGVRRVGLIFPALSERAMEFLRDQESQSRFEDASRLIDGDETCALARIIAPGAALGGLHQPDAHQVPTARVAAELSRRLVAMGVDVQVGVEVDRAMVSGGRVAGLETSAGLISTGAVINASGAGARALGLRNEIEIAAVGIPESRFLTEPIGELPDDLPMLLFYERDLLYLRGEAGGLLVGAIERELGGDSADGERALAGHVRLARGFAGVVPALGRARVAAGATGHPTFTPDGRPVIGPAPGVDGYIVLTGCNESGVTHGPGLGRLAARLVVDGATDADLSEYRVDRFDDLTEAELRGRAAATYLRRNRLLDA
jgi:glycine/D-amino acid oxidase-like deaminating enzyme